MPGGISLERLKEAGFFYPTNGLSPKEVIGLKKATEMVVTIEDEPTRIAIRPIVVIENPNTPEQTTAVVFKPVGSVAPLAQAMLGLVG